MLATRSLRLAATRYVHPAHFAWSSSATRSLPMLQPISTQWITKPFLAAFSSKDAKTADTESNPSTNTVASSKPFTNPLTENPPKESQTSISDNISSTASSSSDTSVPKSPSSSASDLTENAKTQTDKCSTGSLDATGVKLPSKDQVERFIFKSLVYLWDFAYYVFCLSRKLSETYVFNNSTVQHYWKELLKRMEDARKEIK